ncbi:MAG: hypothetical protein P8Y36_11030, partial [Alphaproteobacteria bacterium]
VHIYTFFCPKDWADFIYVRTYLRWPPAHRAHHRMSLNASRAKACGCLPLPPSFFAIRMCLLLYVHITALDVYAECRYSKFLMAFLRAQREGVFLFQYRRDTQSFANREFFQMLGVYLERSGFKFPRLRTKIKLELPLFMFCGVTFAFMYTHVHFSPKATQNISGGCSQSL